MWPDQKTYFRRTTLESNAVDLAAWLYGRTCRTEFDEPGFCLLNLGKNWTSNSFRGHMVQLKEQLASIHECKTGTRLDFLSLTRFDQQTSCKLHLDGGPTECLLMLGYEPTEVDSSVSLADYSRCAFDLGITPNEFMSQYNPMYRQGLEMLEPYTTQLECFRSREFQILLVNNSSAPYRIDGQEWQGVLHTADITASNESMRRVINSTLIGQSTFDAASQQEIDEFVTTTAVRRRGYDKTHLSEDI